MFLRVVAPKNTVSGVPPIDPIRLWAAPFVHLDAHANLIAVGKDLHLGRRHQAFRLNHLNRKRNLGVSEGPIDESEEDFARLEYFANREAEDFSEGQHAARVAAVTHGPMPPGELDRAVFLFTAIAKIVEADGLHPNAGADDVRLEDVARSTRVHVVSAEAAGPIAKRREVAVQFGVARGRRREPVGRQTPHLCAVIRTPPQRRISAITTGRRPFLEQVKKFHWKETLLTFRQRSPERSASTRARQ